MSGQFHVIIPARWRSSRLPSKMLADIGGLPMVVRTARQALQSSAASVIIATDDPRIEQAAQAHDVRVILTDASHPSGTDRLAQAAKKLGLTNHDLIVNVQGDEPLINPALIDVVAHALAQDPQADMATCASPLTDQVLIDNPNIVKVVCNHAGHALYFSRAPIPYVRAEQPQAPYLHHIGLYAYRQSFLLRFSQLPPGQLEQTEMLEQLRALEHGHLIHVSITDIVHHGGVDTPEDLARVRKLIGS